MLPKVNTERGRNRLLSKVRFERVEVQLAGESNGGGDVVERTAGFELVQEP